MKFFKNILGKDVQEPCYTFGRFSDVYQAEERQIYWEQAIEAHDKKRYLESISLFLSFLSQEEQGNVEVEKVSPEKIKFRIYQGSKCIEGFANQDGFFAQAVIAHCKEISLGAMRSLLEENYELRYSAYALDSDDNLTMVMHTDHQDGSPYKLYYGLKELATQADRRDDVLVAEFKELSPVYNGNITPLNERDKRIRIQYFRSELKRAIDIFDRDAGRFDKYPGLLSYILLSTGFTIDYFLKPEGKVMDHVENIYATYFHINIFTPSRKNAEIYRELKKMVAITDEELARELYETKNTFGRLEAAAHIKLQEVTEQELTHFDWYLQSDLAEYAVYIPRYICSLLLFAYALPLLDQKLLHLLLRVLENDFFESLGYVSLIKHDGSIDEKRFAERFSEITSKSIIKNIPFKQLMGQLDFENKALFGESYLRMLSKLDYNKLVL